MRATPLLFDAAIVLYVVGTGAFLAYLLRGRPGVARAARLVTLAGLGVHTASLAARWLEGRVGPAADLYASVSFFAWAIVGASVLFERRYRVPLLGAFATPLAALLMLAASSAPALPVAPPAAARGLWLPVHVAFVFLGDALLALAACAGLMYLLQERTLKAKRVNWMTRRLPSLEVLDAMNSRSLTLGFPLLTVGLLSGAVWARLAWGSFWSWEPKVVLSVLTWALYAVLLHGRLTVGWRGRRAAVGAIAGFVAVLVTLVGVGLFRAGHGLA
jgi:cytochrome c-type biogenesis protein CcsB